MATLCAGISSNSDGVVEGAYTSSVFTSLGSPVTVAVFGEFKQADAVIELSTYNDGSEDIYFQFESLPKGPSVRTVDVEAGVKLRVSLKNLVATSSITATVGGGNT